MVAAHITVSYIACPTIYSHYLCPQNKSQTAPDLTPLPHVRDNVEKAILGTVYSLWTGLPILPGRHPRYGQTMCNKYKYVTAR